MYNQQVSDDSLKLPDEDLLGMREYPRRLARFLARIPLPFTIGVYGEWGSGKTSFVQFLKHFLTGGDGDGNGDPVKFISFSAWPYRTPDELWRALLLTIAQELYECPPPPGRAAPVPAGQPTGLWSWLTGLLGQEALVWHAPPPPVDPLAEYKDLVARLDVSLPASISKDAEQRSRLDQEETTLAIVKSAFAALGTMSPLIVGLQRLLGGRPEADLAAVLRREKNEAARERIASMDAFKRALKEVFEKKAQGKRVCVFIDDLDRCMPDAALDLLEAIRIFLDGVPCIFIIAADENLIGQGLRLRFRELLERAGDADTQAFVAQKGREYFEKIIQLGIRVPPRSADQIRRLLAAQFPEWLAAADIISAAIGENPRRLKQYCNLLTYKHDVARSLEKVP